ncbi:hypothetical protein Tco_0851491 [Tanacetum coccineum]
MKFFILQHIAEEKAFANLLPDQADDVRRRLTRLNIMIREMEAIKDGVVIFDSMDCLRDTIRRENDKLFFILQHIAEEKAFANLLLDQADDVRRRLTKLNIMIRKMEAIEDGVLVFDSMDCLRDTIRRE